jgi:C2 domain
LQKTKTKQSAGLTPEWNENFKYTINSIEDFKQSFVLTLKEEDLYEHDTMGDITLPLGLLYIGLKDQAIKIYDKTSLLCVGHIVITTSFDPIK